MLFQDQQRMSVQEYVLLGFITSCVGSLVVSMWYSHCLSGLLHRSACGQLIRRAKLLKDLALEPNAGKMAAARIILCPYFTSIIIKPSLSTLSALSLTVHRRKCACLRDCGSAVSAHIHLQNYTRGQWTGNPVRVICFLWKRAPQHFFSQNRRGTSCYGMPWILPYVSFPAVPAYSAATYGLNIQLHVHYWFVLQTAKCHWCNVTATCTAQQILLDPLSRFTKRSFPIY